MKSYELFGRTRAQRNLSPRWNERTAERARDGQRFEPRHLSLEEKWEFKMSLMPLLMWRASCSRELPHSVVISSVRVGSLKSAGNVLTFGGGGFRWGPIGCSHCTHQLTPSLQTLMGFVCCRVAFQYCGFNWRVTYVQKPWRWHEGCCLHFSCELHLTAKTICRLVTSWEAFRGTLFWNDPQTYPAFQ
jgi:hypothetical protein